MNHVIAPSPKPERLHRLAGWLKPASSSAALQQCTLVIPTYRRPRIMLQLLATLSNLPDCPGEIVVVDGSPETLTAEAISNWARTRSLPFDLRYVKSPAGLTLQRNVGIDAATREFVFFLDDDCLPEPGYFKAIQQVFLDDPAGQIGGVRGFITNHFGQPQSRIWRLRFALGINHRGTPGAYYPTATSIPWDSVAPFHGTRPVDVLAGGAAAYRHEVFTQYRFSRFFYGYSQGEDLEMSRRIARRWKLVLCGSARVHHHHAEGGRPSGFQRGRMAMRNRHFIWKRHSPDAAPIDHLKFWMDHLLIIACHLAGWLRAPWQPAPLCYAAGTLCGILQCALRPPRYVEPPARREYAFAWAELSPA